MLRHHDAVASPAEYATLLLDAGLRVDVWETTYVHVLPARIRCWSGCAAPACVRYSPRCRPTDGAEFSAELAAGCARRTRRPTHGTLLPFRRIFAVAHRPAA